MVQLLNKISILSSYFFSAGALLAAYALSAQNTTIKPSQQIGLPYIQNFSPADYDAGPQNFDITQDQQGLMYFGNGAGVLQFDGSTWRLIPLPNGATVYAVEAAPNGLVYVGGVGYAGWLKPDEKGSLQFVSLLDRIPPEYRDFSQVWIVVTYGPYVFFAADKYLFRWRIDGTEEQMKAWPFKNIYHTCHIVKDEFYVWQWDIGLQKLEGDSLKLVPGGEAFANTTIRIMAPLSIAGQEKIFIGTIQKGFAIYDGKTVQGFRRAPILKEFVDENILYNSIRLHDGTFALATFSGGIALADEGGNLIQLLDKSTGLQDEVVSNVFADQQGQLWLALNDGISRVEIPSPFTYYADELGLSGDVQGVLFHDNEFYAYGSSGFFPMTKPASDDYRMTFRESGRNLSLNSLTSIISLKGEIIAGSTGGIGLIDAVNMRFIPNGTIAYSFTDLLQASRFHQDVIYAGMGNAIGILRKGRQGWKSIGQIQGITENVLSIVEVSPNHLWITTFHSAQKIRIEEESFGEPMKDIEPDPDKKISATLEKFDQSNGFPKGWSSVHLVEGKILFATSAGFRKFNPSTNSFEPDFSLPYSDTTRAIIVFKVQPNEDIWFISAEPGQSELVQLKRTANGKYLEQTVNFQHILSKGTSIYEIDIDPEDPDIAWISTSGGLIKYNSRVEKEYDQTFPTLIRKVIINGDSLLFGGATSLPTAPVLAFANNSMRFEYAAPTYDLPEKNQFQVWLEGFDKDWSNWTAEVKKDYTNLPEGDYTFSVKARNVYGVVGEEGSFTFSILPPWYRSWWAYLFYLLLIVGAIYGLIRWRVRQLKQRTLELEVLVNERTRVVEEQKDRLQEQAERLQELDQMKSRFFTNISHEFRTPLTIIGGMMEQIEKSPQKWLKKGSRMIKRNTANLLNLVNQILDLRKLETGTLQLNLVQGNIISYLRYLLESFHSLAENKNIKLHFLSQEKELMMDYDKEKLLRIVSNLLSNAIKFTPEGGDVYLTVDSSQSMVDSNQLIVDSGQSIVHGDQSIGEDYKSVDKQPSTMDHQPSTIRLTIKDTGLGIPAKKLPYIFDRFYQADDSSTREGEGTGIGLALTKELIKLVEGEIKVESEMGKGSTFRIILPITRAAEREKGDEVTSFLMDVQDTGKGVISSPDIEMTPFSSGMGPLPEKDVTSIKPQSTLLIIEDNPDVVQYLESLLGEQYQVEIARDGQEGIETALEQIPDLIISDVMMPKKNGFEVCETLKSDERTSHIPIVLLTAKADVDSKIAGLKRGADAYLAKPFNQEELFIRLEKLHQLRQLLQARYGTLSHLPQTTSNQQTPTLHTSTPTTLEDTFISKLRSIIEANLDDEKFGIPELCKAIGISRTQLHLKIKALTNRSTSHYIRAIRLYKAKELLRKGELNITQVAYEVGFYDRAYFSRAFTQEFGAPPKEFLKN